VAVALINVRGAMEGERQKAQLALETKQATDRASAIARTRTPEVLRNVKVLTLGSGGLQSALERLAPEPD
jgi:hypothetical protein